MRARTALVAMSLAALALVTAGCGGGGLAHGKRLFDKGRYAEAKAAFVALGPCGADCDDGERARYALYRALTHGALGDLDARDAWLHIAAHIAARDPDALDDEDTARLRIALDQLAWDAPRRP
jgi:hypothetical protein